MKPKRLPWITYLVPAGVAALFILLSFTGFYRQAGGRVYDLLLHLRRQVPEQPSILLLDIDDASIARVGVWPWSRDIMADGLILLAEFGARYALFDIEYTEVSPRGIDDSLLRQEIPMRFSQEFSRLQQNVSDLFHALKTGAIAARDAEGYLHDLIGLTEQSKLSLLDLVQMIARDNDRYLGQAARLFGRTYFTVNLLPDEEKVDPALLEEAQRRIALSNLTRSGPDLPAFGGLRPAIRPILAGAAGAGFPNVVGDPDGVLRRIDLVRRHGDRYYAQLALAPLLDWLGNPRLVLSPGSLRLEGALLPDGARRTIAIPLDADGRMLLNWPPKKYLDSYRHLSFYELVLHRRLEANLLHNLQAMEEASFPGMEEGRLLAPYREAQELLRRMLEGEDAAGMKEYRALREDFLRKVDAFLQGGAEGEILGQVEAVLASAEAPEEEKENAEAVGRQTREFFASSRELARELARSRATLREYLPGAFCIIGLTGASTTDIGVTPFEEAYMNVGTHATVLNTILTGLFLAELPGWTAALAALLLAFAVTFALRRLAPHTSILAGLAALAAAVLVIVAFFLVTGIYLALLTPALTVFFTFVSLTIAKLLYTEREKSFLRHAFGHYLSGDVINELIADPQKLNLGGEKKRLTAVFTDVKGFSTFFEQLDPADLVKLLNEYLTEMSNIILDLRGTIDKYEGDAIISFFGAPVPFGDHARNACRAAVRMKKMERLLNERLLAEGLAPSPLLTRIGINTGEMVVGNMGTPKKMDYTIMGSSANLASRLEGVNKQYGTWILAGETTYREGGADFLARRMDRVRVVGIDRPVRLYELLDEKAGADGRLREAVEIFHQGLERFESRDWGAAKKCFQETRRLRPDDGPAAVFLKRCDDFAASPPPATWDGVFNLAVK